MSRETIESWDRDLFGHDPSMPDHFWTLRFEYDDDRVYPESLLCNGEEVSEQDYPAVFSAMIDLAYEEMKDMDPDPAYVEDWPDRVKDCNYGRA